MLPLQTTAEIGSMRCCHYMEAREREALWRAYFGSGLPCSGFHRRDHDHLAIFHVHCGGVPVTELALDQ